MRDRLRAILHSSPSMNSLGIHVAPCAVARGRAAIFAPKIISVTVTNVYRRDFTYRGIRGNYRFPSVGMIISIRVTVQLATWG